MNHPTFTVSCVTPLSEFIFTEQLLNVETCGWPYRYDFVTTWFLCTLHAIKSYIYFVDYDHHHHHHRHWSSSFILRAEYTDLNNCKKLTLAYFLSARQPAVGQGLLIHEVSRSRNDAPQSVGLLKTSDQLVAETCT